MPDFSHLEIYSKIFVAQIDFVEINEQEFHIGGYSDSHNLELTVIKPLKGNVDKHFKIFSLSACALPVPRFGDTGIFFVKKDTSAHVNVIPIYSYEGEIYQNALAYFTKQ